MKPELSIIIPTVDGREESLARLLAALEKKTSISYETLIISNKPTCGIAWNIGIRQSVGDYVAILADDLEPADSGWVDAGKTCLETGAIPCAMVLNSDGTIQSCGNAVAKQVHDGTPASLARIPFLTQDLAQLVYPIIDAHYYTDNWITWKAAQHGWSTVVWSALCFYHHYVPAGRLDERIDQDEAEFRRLTGNQDPWAVA
jgi:hypothetical protein